MPTLAPRPSTASTTAGSAVRRRSSRTWKYALAAIIALLLHGALILLLTWGWPRWPRPPVRHGRAPIQLMIEPSAPTETPDAQKNGVAPPQQDYIRTPDDRKSETPPVDPKFISHQDTEANSLLAADDPFKPLPTQDGKKLETFEFDTNPYRPGKEASDSASAAAPGAQAPAPTPPPDTPKPEAKSSPPPRSATPAPTPAPGDFAIQRADSSPSDTPPLSSPTPASVAASTPPPPRRRPSNSNPQNPSVNSTGVPLPPGYQPETVQTKMAGNISNHDLGRKTSVAAQGTPLGRYEKAVNDAIGARWYFNVEENMSTLIRTGEVKIHFVVTRSGRIINTRISGKNQNTTLADISLEAVVNAEVPPIPEEVASLLPEGELEGDLTFEMY